LSMRYQKLLEKLVMLGAAASLLAPAPLLAEGRGELNLFDFSNESAHPLVALVINFALLVVIVYLVLRKPLGKRFRDRKADLVKAIEEAREAKARAEEAAEAARAKMAAIDQALSRLREEIRGAGKTESAHIVEAAEARSRRLIEDTRILIEGEVARAAQGIREEVAERIIEEARQLIRDRISEADHARLHAEYLNEISKEGASPFGKP
jgi:F-type H+-transporting ATPase subunit b